MLIKIKRKKRKENDEKYRWWLDLREAAYGRQKIASAISITHLIIESPRVVQRGHRGGGGGGEKKRKEGKIEKCARRMRVRGGTENETRPSFA